MACHALGAATSRCTTHAAWRTLKTADFAVALTTPAMAKSPHFALHHLAARPASACWQQRSAANPEISTAHAPDQVSLVDKLAPKGHFWLGLVVPKRYARHAVTRNLIKRQMRAQAAGNQHRLRPGQWVVRLRAPVDTRAFASASSSRLQSAMRAELELVFERAARG